METFKSASYSDKPLTTQDVLDFLQTIGIEIKRDKITMITTFDPVANKLLKLEINTVLTPTQRTQIRAKYPELTL